MVCKFFNRTNVAKYFQRDHQRNNPHLVVKIFLTYKSPFPILPFTESRFLSIDGVAKDFIDEIPKTWKTIVISNSYDIKDLILPKDEKDSRLLRLNTVRKGVMNRVLEVDGKTFKNKLEFSA